MKLELYPTVDAWAADVYEILLENEVQNNLPISFIQRAGTADASGWIMAAVKDDAGSVVLTAVCTPPYNILLYETGNRPSGQAVHTLAQGLRDMGLTFPGVMTEGGLARRFADAWAGQGGWQAGLSMISMRLDSLAPSLPKAAGSGRWLRQSDLAFAPYWQRAFGIECQVEHYDYQTHYDSLVARFLGKDTFYVWEDEYPVSQACAVRATQKGIVIGGVYTPPYLRGRGYATSTVSQLCRILLDRGYDFCALYADAANPISCGMYRKMGFRDIATVDTLLFAKNRRAGAIQPRF